MALADPASLAPEIHVPAFRLNGDAITARLSQLVIDGEIETTIEGASTLTLNVREQDDELHRMVAGGLFTVPVIKGKKRSPSRPVIPALRQGTRMRALGMDWELVHCGKQGDEWTFVFEDWRVAALRRLDRPRKFNRDKLTRAQAIKAITADELKKPKIVFVSPELRKRQPIAKVRDRTRETVREEARDRGIPRDAKLRGKGPLSPGQIGNAERVLDVAAAHEGAGPRAALALLEACIVEAPDFTNPTGGDLDSVGILQLRSMHLGGSVSTNGGRRDIELVCHLFLTRGFAGRGGAIELARQNPGWSPGEIAQAVQGSAYPGRYDQYRTQAEEILDEYGGATGRYTRVTEKKYEFSRGRPGGPLGEDSWEAAKRLADEVGWRLFMVRDRLYYMAEEDLIASKPRLTIVEGERGVENLDYEVDSGHAVDQATVTCRSRLWLAPPGSVVKIDAAGSADGRWLVSSCRRPIFDLTTTIELRRNRALLSEKKEPAPETRTRTISGKLNRGATEEGGGGVSEVYDAVYDEAVRISNMNLPYVWGGGHNATGDPSGGGYDCSGYVGRCLYVADIGAPAHSSVFMSWGEPGPGRHFTVYSNDGHVFIEFYGREWKRADTSPHGSGGSGPHVRSNHRDHSGFVARHWPGE